VRNDDGEREGDTFRRRAMKRQLRNLFLATGPLGLLAVVLWAPHDASAQAMRDTLGRESIVTPTSRSVQPVLGSLPTIQQRPTSVTGVTLTPAQQFDTDIMPLVEPVELEAQRSEIDLTTRLAREFGLTARQLERQRQALNATWSDLLIAHTLAANARGQITVNRVFEQLARGQSWSTIATNLGLSLSQLMNAVRHEALVAAGLMRPDGRVQTVARSTTLSSTVTSPGTRTPVRIIRGSGATAR
jgi:hypothetical protein